MEKHEAEKHSFARNASLVAIPLVVLWSFVMLTMLMSTTMSALRG